MVFQALLGMWTVTWQLETGVLRRTPAAAWTTLSLLAWLVLRQGHYGISDPLTVGDRALRGFAVLGLLLLVGLTVHWVVGPAPITPRWPARTFRPAKRIGGRRWIFGRRSPYGEDWGFPTKAVCWATMPE
ncbi:MAG: hypothetical protein R3F36_03605 [Candidatus Competibacteraceae bacterium]